MVGMPATPYVADDVSHAIHGDVGESNVAHLGGQTLGHELFLSGRARDTHQFLQKLEERSAIRV